MGDIVGGVLRWFAVFRPPREAGSFGEWLAARTLQRKGYRIVARNVSARHGEIDLIARQGDVVAFVEVRTRRLDAAVSPEESVVKDKQRVVEQSARELLNGPYRWAMKLTVRFDVIAIEIARAGKGRWKAIRVDHHERAFEPHPSRTRK